MAWRGAAQDALTRLLPLPPGGDASALGPPQDCGQTHAQIPRRCPVQTNGFVALQMTWTDSPQKWSKNDLLVPLASGGEVERALLLGSQQPPQLRTSHIPCSAPLVNKVRPLAPPFGGAEAGGAVP